MTTPAAAHAVANEFESVTRKVTIHGENASLVMYVTVGFLPSGAIQKITVKTAKKGSTLSGFANAWAEMVSLALEHGIPWEVVLLHFNGWRFDPMGTTVSELGNVRSPVDAAIKFAEKARFEREQRKNAFKDPKPTVPATAPAPAVEAAPLPMLLFCPHCHRQHVDEGEWATKPHRVHLCLNSDCGQTWRPADVSTVGVASL